MANDFYNSSGAPGQGAPGSSAAIRAQFAALGTAFDKLPTLTGNGGRAIRVNSGGTGLEASSVLTLTALSVNSPGTAYQAVLSLDSGANSAGQLSPALVFSASNVNAAIYSARYSGFGGSLILATQAVAGGTPTERMRIDAAGYVYVAGANGLGITGAYKHQVSGTYLAYGDSNGFRALNSATTGAVGLYAEPGSAGGGRLDAEAGPLAFAAGGVERMRLDANGNLVLGVASAFGTSALGHLHLSSSSSGGQLFLRNAAATAGKFWQIGPDNSTNGLVVYNQSNIGVYMLDGTTAWAANSDERIKTDLMPIADAAAKVASLRAVTGRYTADAPGTSRAFLIAQDVQKVLPEAVDVQADDMGTLGVRYTDVIPLLVAALNENTQRMDAMTKEISRLRAELELNLPEP